MLHSTVRAPLSVIAHRGFSARYRENSPKAWRAAAEAGADFIEADIRMTRDGVLVCSHDADLTRLAGRPAAIDETDAAELALITVEGDAAAPLLDELFAVLPSGQPVLFDVKDERPEAMDRLLAASVACERSGLVVFGLHHIASVHHVRAQTDALILGLLSSPEDKTAFFAAGGDSLRLWESDATPERLEAVVGQGQTIWVTTGSGDTGRKVGDFDANAMRCMAANGASGFLVNDPVAARTALVATPAETAR